jgi:hypothetical protein
MFHPELKTLQSTRKAKPLVLLAIAAAALCMSQTSMAAAAEATGVVNITASVTPDCAVGTSTLAFGSASSTTIQAGNVDATGTVSVNCTTGVGYTIKLDVGAGAGATFASRKMTPGANLLNYSIYDSAGRTSVWGDGTGATVTVASTGTGAAQSISAYGRIFGAQTPPPGTYTDTVNVTVSY